jgi:hypothetical protein
MVRARTFNLGNEARRLTRRTAGRRHRNADPDVLPILSHVALDQLIAADISRSETTPLSGLGFEVVGVRNVDRIHPLQLAARKTEHYAHRPIRPEDAPIRCDEGHRVRCVLERLRKKRLAGRLERAASEWLLWAKGGQTHSLPV